MEYQDISLGVEDGIGTITLNRPEVLNSFANQMRQGIAAAVHELLDRDPAAEGISAFVEKHKPNFGRSK
ncbi:MAG: hypothetical protein PVJ64_13900 [Gemmatimonadales bacterium]